MIARTRPPATSKSKTTLASPRRNHADAGRSSTSTGNADCALPLKKAATSSRPSMRAGVPARTAAYVGADDRVGASSCSKPGQVAARAAA